MGTDQGEEASRSSAEVAPSLRSYLQSPFNLSISAAEPRLSKCCPSPLMQLTGAHDPMALGGL